MSDNTTEAIKISKDELLILHNQLIKQNEELCEKSELKLENKFNELTEKFTKKNQEKFDRYRNYAILIIGVLSFFGITSAKEYVKGFIDENVQKQISAYREETTRQIKDLENQIRSAIHLNDSFLQILSEKQKTILIELTKRADYESINKLLNYHNIDADISDESGRCALWYAVDRSDLRIVEALLKKKVRIDCPGFVADGYTPLLKALANEDYPMAKLLIDNGANINCTNKESQTPLFFGIRSKNYNLVQSIINKGANVNHILNRWQNNALLEATEQNDFQIVKLITDKITDIDFSNINDETALILAAQKDNADIAKYLISKGANKNKAYDWAKKNKNEKIKEFIDRLN